MSEEDNVVSGSIERMVEGYNQLSIESYRNRLTIIGFVWAAIGIVLGSQLTGVATVSIWWFFASLLSASLGIVSHMAAYEIARYRYKKLQLAGESQYRVKQIIAWNDKIRQAQDVGSIDAEKIARDILWVIKQDEMMGKASLNVSFRSLFLWGRFTDIAGFVCTILALFIFLIAVIS